MNSPRASAATCLVLMLAAVVLWLVTGFTLAEAAAPVASSINSPASSVLRTRYDALRQALANNVFQRPLVMESNQTSKELKGEIYAVVPYSYASVSESLAGPQAWCDVLILHLNTKYCRASRDAKGTSLQMNVGKKFDQPLTDSFGLAFDWQLTDQKADYFRVQLSAENGPLSTRDYRIVLEGIPLENGTTFLHLSYSYGFGLGGKLAMQAYLGTIGRNKVGFTVTGRTTDGQPEYVDGMRGLVERNTMRYHLAVDSYLGSLAVPERAQFEKRINDWFNAAERYPRQLHEMERDEYLSMKRKEYRRQQQDQKTVGLI